MHFSARAFKVTFERQQDNLIFKVGLMAAWSRWSIRVHGADFRIVFPKFPLRSVRLIPLCFSLNCVDRRRSERSVLKP